MELPKVSKEYLTHVDATPDRGYPLRILTAHRQNCNGHWIADPPNPLYDLMNEHQIQRAKLLDEAIAILEKYFST